MVETSRLHRRSQRLATAHLDLSRQSMAMVSQKAENAPCPMFSRIRALQNHLKSFIDFLLYRHIHLNFLNCTIEMRATSRPTARTYTQFQHPTSCLPGARIRRYWRGRKEPTQIPSRLLSILIYTSAPPYIPTCRSRLASPTLNLKAHIQHGGYC